MITREQCLKWAEEAGFNVENGSVNDGIETAADFSAEIEALCQRAWNEAIEAAADCAKQHSYGFVVEEIRNLKEKS